MEIKQLRDENDEYLADIQLITMDRLLLVYLSEETMEAGELGWKFYESIFYKYLPYHEEVRIIKDRKEINKDISELRKEATNKGYEFQIDDKMVTFSKKIPMIFEIK